MSKNSHKGIEIGFDLPDDVDADQLGHICYQVSEGIRRAAESHRYTQSIYLSNCTPTDRDQPRIGRLRIVRRHGSRVVAPKMSKPKNIGPKIDRD